MTGAIETRYLLPPDSEASAFEKTLAFVEEDEEYELNEDGEDIMGRSRIHFSRDEFNIEITYDDISSKYPGGTLGKLRVQVARLGGTSDLDNAPDLWKLIESTTDIYRLLPQNAVAVYSLEPGQGPSVPVADGDVPPCDREFVTWFDVYPPSEVETIGRETLLSAPAPHVEELDDGSVLAVSKHPTSGDSLNEVADHVGIPTWGSDTGLT